jgi:hypothetical protein
LPRVVLGNVLAYNRGNLWRPLVLPERIDGCSVAHVQPCLIKTGGRVFLSKLEAFSTADARKISADAILKVTGPGPEIQMCGWAKAGPAVGLRHPVETESVLRLQLFYVQVSLLLALLGFRLGVYIRL